MITEEPRPPSERERSVIEYLLSPEEDVSPLYGEHLDGFRSRIDDIRVATNCVCGCGSFAIYVDGVPARTKLFGHGPSAWNEDIATEICLFIAHGEMQAVEVTYYDHDRFPPAGVPTVEGFNRDYRWSGG